VIKSFSSRETEALLGRVPVRRFGPDLQRTALRKLLQLDAATRLETLNVPPGNRLEVLRGERKERHSIRVNDQWRICFRWENGNAFDVELVDYH
jgi:proteic killer suppression protein